MQYSVSIIVFWPTWKPTHFQHPHPEKGPGIRNFGPSTHFHTMFLTAAKYGTLIHLWERSFFGVSCTPQPPELGHFFYSLERYAAKAGGTEGQIFTWCSYVPIYTTWYTMSVWSYRDRFWNGNQFKAVECFWGQTTPFNTLTRCYFLKPQPLMHTHTVWLRLSHQLLYSNIIREGECLQTGNPRGLRTVRGQSCPIVRGQRPNAPKFWNHDLERQNSAW